MRPNEISSFPGKGMSKRNSLVSKIKRNHLKKRSLFPKSFNSLLWSENVLLCYVQSIKLILLLVSKAIFTVRFQNANSFHSLSLKCPANTIQYEWRSSFLHKWSSHMSWVLDNCQSGSKLYLELFLNQTIYGIYAKAKCCLYCKNYTELMCVMLHSVIKVSCPHTQKGAQVQWQVEEPP